MLRFALGFFVAMIVSFVATGIYLGYYKPVDIRIDSPPKFYLLGVENTGPYHLVNEKIEEVEFWVKAHNVACPKTFGMYLDDPELVEPEKLRSFVGCLVDKKPEITFPSSYQYKELSINKAYIAFFTGSPALGPLKVYPEAKDWFSKNNLRWQYSLELYKLQDEKFETEYLFPIPANEVNVNKLRL